MNTMKHISCSVFILLQALQVQAIEPTKKASAYNHLLDVNAQWVYHKVEAPNVQVSFRNEDERIKFHLQNVISILQESQPTKTKTQLLTELWQYAEVEQFPVNTGHTNRNPYFIDYQKTHCAVGYLMKVSGHEKLAQRIRKEHNYDFIKDIHTKGIPEWANEFGFTEAELAWIQPGYPVVNVFQPIDGQLNGLVKGMSSSWDPEGLFMYGNFNSVNNGACFNNLAYYDGTQLQCVGFDVQGTVNDMLSTGYGLVVVGDLMVGGDPFPLAHIHDETVVETYSIPDRPTAIGLAYHSFGSSEYLAIQSEVSGQCEIWEHSLINGGWTLSASVAGQVNGITAAADGLIAYGAFQSATVYTDILTDTTFQTDNIFSWSNYTSPSGFSGAIPDTVHCVITVGNATYISGASEPTEPVLSRYLNGVTQPLIFAAEFPQMKSIRDVKSYDQGTFVISGDFDIQPFVGYYGKNLALYNPIANDYWALGAFSLPVNVALKFNDQWYVGGEFTEQLDQTAKYVAMMSDPTDIEDRLNSSDVKVFPNPVTDNLNITLQSNWSGIKTAKLFSLDGKLHSEQPFHGQKHTLSMSGIAAGKYILIIAGGATTSTTIVVKQ
jgi:hypothetical protein